jgi:hypothetical protein
VRRCGSPLISKTLGCTPYYASAWGERAKFEEAAPTEGATTQRDSPVKELRELWRQHRLTPFPRSDRGNLPPTEWLAEIDALIAGYVETYLGGTALHGEAIRNLREAAQQLRPLVPSLPAEQRPYAERLVALAEGALAGAGVEVDAAVVLVLMGVEAHDGLLLG